MFEQMGSSKIKVRELEEEVVVGRRTKILDQDPFQKSLTVRWRRKGRESKMK
jgi:hypothetical protein